MDNRFKILSLLLILLSACSTTNTETAGPFITPPFKGVNIPSTNFIVSATKDIDINIGNGTRIFIPKNSLVNTQGELVQDSVIIQFKTMYDALEAFVSGIPMNFTDAQKQKQHMQTAGMFELTAITLDSQKVKMKEGKEIDFTFASNINDKTYNFFQLDSNIRNWVDLGETQAIANPIKAKLQSEFTKNTTEAKRLKTKLDNKLVFYDLSPYDVGMMKLFQSPQWTDYDKMRPQLNKLVNTQMRALQKKADNYDMQLYHFPVFWGYVNFKGKAYSPTEILWKKASGSKVNSRWKKTNDAQYIMSRFSEVKEDRKALKGIEFKPLRGNLCKFIRTFQNGKKKETLLEGIAPLKLYYKYTPKQWEENYDSLMQVIGRHKDEDRMDWVEMQRLMEIAKKQREQASRQYAFVRKLKLANFGTYNCDYLYRVEEQQMVNVKTQFNWETPSGVTLTEEDKTYCNWSLFLEDDRSVISFSYNKEKPVSIPDGAMLMAVLPNNQIALCQPDQQVDFTNIRSQGKQEQATTISLSLQVFEEKVESVEQLKAIVKQFKEMQKENSVASR